MAEIQAIASGAFRAAYFELTPQFERVSGHKVVTTLNPSVQIMKRLTDGEMFDVTLLSASSIDELISLGKIARRYDLARSGIGVAVRAGAQRPDISSGDAVKRAVLAAKAIAYSTGPSGVYLVDLFQRMGIADRIKDKVRIAFSGEPAGAIVARGDAEIAFQQVSELLPVAGIDLLGPLPPDIQEITTFSAGVHARAAQPVAAEALIGFFTTLNAAPIIRKNGMEPVRPESPVTVP